MPGLSNALNTPFKLPSTVGSPGQSIISQGDGTTDWGASAGNGLLVLLDSQVLTSVSELVFNLSSLTISDYSRFIIYVDMIQPGVGRPDAVFQFGNFDGMGFTWYDPSLSGDQPIAGAQIANYITSTTSYIKNNFEWDNQGIPVTHMGAAAYFLSCATINVMISEPYGFASVFGSGLGGYEGGFTSLGGYTDWPFFSTINSFRFVSSSNSNPTLNIASAYLYGVLK